MCNEETLIGIKTKLLLTIKIAEFSRAWIIYYLYEFSKFYPQKADMNMENAFRNKENINKYENILRKIKLTCNVKCNLLKSQKMRFAVVGICFYNHCIE